MTKIENGVNKITPIQHATAMFTVRLKCTSVTVHHVSIIRQPPT